MAPNNTTNGTLPELLVTTAIVPTISTFPPLTEHELKKQKLFSILVIACFFSFLIFVIGYVTFTHVKRNRRIIEEKRALEAEEEDKPKINRRTSVMGQGQKQVVIERKASVLSGHRKSSSISSPVGNGQNNHNQQAPQLNTKLLRQPPQPWLNIPQMPAHFQPPQMGGQQPINLHMNGPVGGYSIPPPITHSRIEDNYTFPNTYPMNAFNENVLVRYCQPDLKERHPTEEGESGLSSSGSMEDSKKLDEEDHEGGEQSDGDETEENDHVFRSISTNESEPSVVSENYRFATEDTRLLAAS